MSIRKQALANRAFMQMKDIYENRECIVKEWKKQGKKVAGVLGCDVPDELLMAADIMPYRIYGEKTMELSETDKYLEFSFPPAVRAQFEKIIKGTDREYMDYLIISNSTDALTRIYFYIREIKSIEPEKPIPEICFIDWLFTRYRMHQMRNETIIGEFRKQLELWSGKEITDEAIRNASRLCNENRRLMEQAAQLRKEGRINGSEALVIIGASMYMEKEKHSALLKELLEEAAAWEKTDGIKVFVTGSAHEYRDFYETLEEMGMVVVSEDHDWGDRHWHKQTNTELEPVKGIVDRYMLRSVGTKRAFVSERVQVVCNAAKASGAQGVISYTHIYDDAPSWDFPEQKKALTKMGIPALQLSGRNYQFENSRELKNVLKTFLEEVKEG